jgi:trk system potassium uptake protein TrkH
MFKSIKSFFNNVPVMLECLINGPLIFLHAMYLAKRFPDWLTTEVLQTSDAVSIFLIPLILIIGLIVYYRRSASLDIFLRKHVFTLIVLIPILISAGDVEFTFWLASAHLLSTILTLAEVDKKNLLISSVADKKKKSKLFSFFSLRPAQMVFFSFFGVIITGAFMLMLPISANEGVNVQFIDALFISTSATCVTGLATISIVDTFSVFGQVVVAILIEIGGLSIMTLYASMAIFLGQSLEMKDRIMMMDVLDASNLEQLLSEILNIAKYALFIQLWGMVILTIAFTFEGFDFSTALYFGFFHSISAFCNAGFALFNNNLEGFVVSPAIHLTIAILIILGGLGFMVLREITDVFAGTRKLNQFTLHSKVVLTTTGVLLASGSIFIFFGEFLNTLDSYSLWEKMQIAFFQSVTLRTAGFNSIPFASLHAHTIFMMILFMFVGGSPGSTAGGIKTTSLAILFESIRTTLKGKDQVVIFKRKISSSLVVKTTALTFLSIVCVSTILLIMLKVEPRHDFLSLFFEVVSAFGTVGLSLGITPFLSSMGKFVIVIMMFIGRIGPLTLLLAMPSKRYVDHGVNYPEGRILIG